METFLNGKEIQFLDREKLMKDLVMLYMLEKLNLDSSQEVETVLLLSGLMHLKSKRSLI